MATGILRFSPDLVNTWLLKQLRRVSIPLTKANPKSSALQPPLQVDALLSTDQEIIILATTARALEADHEAVLDSLNNIHGRYLNGNGLAHQIGNLASALETADYESVRLTAVELSPVILELQSNIPAWDYVRGLQRLVTRCRGLKGAA
ncbi:MAG: hypothetical protein GY899_00925 [Verrucomicrobiaceae bacterium]|nr:hypothetical protein [Verrucomicrobiaceae bacterium]